MRDLTANLIQILYATGQAMPLGEAQPTMWVSWEALLIDPRYRLSVDLSFMAKEVTMFVAIRRYKISLQAVDDVTQQVQTGFLPLISQTPGFVEYYWVNAGNGSMVSVGIFEDQASAEASTTAAANYVRQFLATLVRNPPEVVEGEIIIHQVGPLTIPSP